MNFRKGVVLPLLFGAVIAMAFAVNAFGDHQLPLGAQKDRVVFVPAYKQCYPAGVAPKPNLQTAPPNSTHGAPLSDVACADQTPFGGSNTGPRAATDNAYGGAGQAGPNIQWNSSDVLTKGRGSGFIEVRCHMPSPTPPTDPAYWTTEVPPCSTTPGENMDIFVSIAIRDVQCALTASGPTPTGGPGGGPSPGTSCGAANDPGIGPDYTGRLLLITTIRITDHYDKEPGGTFVATGTKIDTPFGVGVQCVATALTNRGSDCFIDTSANQVVPTVTKENLRGDVELGQIEVLDAGDDGLIVGKPPPGTGICPPSCTLTGDEGQDLATPDFRFFPFLRMGVYSP